MKIILGAELFCLEAYAMTLGSDAVIGTWISYYTLQNTVKIIIYPCPLETFFWRVPYMYTYIRICVLSFHIVLIDITSVFRSHLARMKTAWYNTKWPMWYTHGSIVLYVVKAVESVVTNNSGSMWLHYLPIFFSAVFRALGKNDRYSIKTKIKARIACMLLFKIIGVGSMSIGSI